MAPVINGLHHVTAIAADPQRNHDFWTRILGLRFVKKTVNFDDPSAYHLYYGDEVGTPGSVLTFFAWGHLPRGREGVGEASLTAFAVPPGSLGFWADRLAAHGVEREPPAVRLGEETLVFQDPDGLKAALVVPGEPDARTPWTTPEITAGHAVRGFHGVTLTLAEGAPTARLLTELLGYEPAGREDGRHRYVAPHAAHARCVDIVERPGGPWAAQGAGRVHHIAFAVADDAAQAAIRERLTAAGLGVTPPIDRTYFRSIYFRSPGGVLFEVATATPGFTVDEAPGELGRNLRLPPQHEPLRARLERDLPPLVP